MFVVAHRKRRADYSACLTLDHLHLGIAWQNKPQTCAPPNPPSSVCTSTLSSPKARWQRTRNRVHHPRPRHALCAQTSCSQLLTLGCTDSWPRQQLGTPTCTWGDVHPCKPCPPLPEIEKAAHIAIAATPRNSNPADSRTTVRPHSATLTQTHGHYEGLQDTRCAMPGSQLSNAQWQLLRIAQRSHGSTFLPQVFLSPQPTAS